MAMPEVGIGLIPDVGGTLILSRAPGLLGLHAALTGVTFNGADAIALGFADHRPHDKLGEFKEAIIADGIDAALTGTRSSHRRASCWHNGIGSTSAMPARPSQTSSPRCAATTRARPTTRPT